jgi:hypothetical protein
MSQSERAAAAAARHRLLEVIERLYTLAVRDDDRVLHDLMTDTMLIHSHLAKYIPEPVLHCRDE